METKRERERENLKLYYSHIAKHLAITVCDVGKIVAPLISQIGQTRGPDGAHVQCNPVCNKVVFHEITD